MDHADREIFSFDAVREFLAAESEINQIRNLVDPVGLVLVDGRTKGLEPHPPVVKIRNRIDQRPKTQSARRPLPLLPFQRVASSYEAWIIFIVSGAEVGYPD